MTQQVDLREQISSLLGEWRSEIVDALTSDDCGFGHNIAESSYELAERSARCYRSCGGMAIN